MQDSERNAYAQRDEDGACDTPGFGLEIDCTGHGYQAANRTDGDVDAAADHDDAKPECHDDERSIEVEQVKKRLEL